MIKLSARDESLRHDPMDRKVFVETSDGVVVTLAMADLGKLWDGKYATSFEGVLPSGIQFRIKSLCDLSVRDGAVRLHDARMAADEATLWKGLPGRGLLPWTAYLSGGYPLFPNRMEYGRYAETDMFHTISG